MIHFDATALTRLAKILDTAGAAVAAGSAAALNERAQRVASEARSTAAGYPKGTGALAADVNVSVSGNEAHIFTGQREGYFLEVGSPNTGAPRPWLSGPAEVSAADLGEALRTLGVLW